MFVVNLENNDKLILFRKLGVTLTIPKAPLTLALEDKPERLLRCGETFKPRIIFSSGRDEEFEVQYTALSRGKIVKTGRKTILAGRKEVYNPYESPDMVELRLVDEVCFIDCFSFSNNFSFPL